MRNGIRGWLTVALVLTTGVVLSGCAQSRFTGNDRARRAVSPAEVSSPLTAHVVRPELLAGIHSIEIARPSLDAPTGSVSIQPDDALRMIEQAARETMTLKILTQTRGEPASGAQRASGKFSPDAILYTDLLRFEERQGSAIGGEPAVISFKMSLRSAPSGAEVWTAQYFFRQEALSENLLRINERLGREGMGAGWRSAHDVFQRGVSSALQEFSNQREKRFLVSKR